MPTSDFWLELWEKNQIGWHQEEVNPQLEQYLLPRLAEDDELIFVPLCGKSRDMAWMLDQGCRVLGVELSDLAAKEFFREQGLEYSVIEEGPTRMLHADRIDIYVDDFFNLKPSHLVGVTTVYDRGALVAIEPEKQARYVSRLIELLPETARVLLLSVEYEGTMTGPPFSVCSDDIENWYANLGPVDVLERTVFDDARFRERGAENLAQQVCWIEPG